MQAILRRSLPETCTNIGLMNHDVDDQVENLLQSFARIYQAGTTVNVKHLYPQIDGIVPSGTPMIGPLVQWEHSQDYPTVTYKHSGGYGVAASCTITFDPLGTNSRVMKD